MGKKYKDIVAEMLHHLELSLPGYSIEQPAQAGPTSFATEGESGRVLRLVTSHDLNAVKWIKDYTNRETTIRTGCYLAVENCKLEDEMQENLGRALVMLFERHSMQDIEKIIRLDGHLSKKIKEIQQSLTAVAEEEANEGRRLRNTKKEMENIQNIRCHIKFEYVALIHHVLNYNLMSSIDIDIPPVIQNIFTSMRNTEDPATWGIQIMTNMEFKRCLYSLSLIKLLVGTTSSSIPQDKSFKPLVHLILNPNSRFCVYAAYLLRRDPVKSNPEGLRKCNHCNKQFTWGKLHQHLTHVHGAGEASQRQGKRRRRE